MSAARPPFSIPEHVLARKLDDEMVLLNLDSGEYFGLNDTGTRVWELLADGRDRDEVVDCLTEEFEVAAEVASSHVATLCDELLRAGLLAEGGAG
jgi:hypothetical protein